MSDLARRTYREQALQSMSSIRIVDRLMQGILVSVEAAIDAAIKGNIDERHAHVSKVCKVLASFQQALDVDQGGQIAVNLDALYRFAIRRLVDFEIRNDPGIAREVVTVLSPLAASWRSLAEPAAETPRSPDTMPVAGATTDPDRAAPAGRERQRLSISA